MGSTIRTNEEVKIINTESKSDLAGRNTQFALLQFFAIVAVVIGHIGGVNWFKDWFPIYQYHIPLFLFISGYFYKKTSEEKCVNYIKRKAKRLMLPFIYWHIFYCGMFYLFYLLNITDWADKPNLQKFFCGPFWDGSQWQMNGASWFVPTLFIVEIVHILIRKGLSFIHVKTELYIVVLLLTLGMIGVSFTYQIKIYYWTGTLVKALFGLGVFGIGFYYKAVLEKYLDKIPSIIYFTIVFACQFYILDIAHIETKISMWNCKFNQMQGDFYTPFLTILPPMLFFIRLSKILVPYAKKSKIVDVISRNTFSIMMHHQFVVILMNLVVLNLSMHFKDIVFNEEKFRTYAWYIPKLWLSDRSRIIFVFGSIVGSLLIGKMSSYINKVVKEKVSIFFSKCKK